MASGQPNTHLLEDEGQTTARLLSLLGQAAGRASTPADLVPETLSTAMLPVWHAACTLLHDDERLVQQVMPLATNSTPFMASDMPLTSTINNPFALRPHYGSFDPKHIDEVSHGLDSAHHSSGGASTRVFISSLFPSRQSLPPSSEKSFVVPTLPQSLSDHLPPQAPPVYQEGQVCVFHTHVYMLMMSPKIVQAVAPSAGPALGPAAQYRQQRRAARERQRHTLGALAGVQKENLHKVFSFLDDSSLVRAGAVCQRFHSVFTSDKLWSPRVTALRRLLRSYNQPLPPRAAISQWQQHAMLLATVAGPAMHRCVWGNLAAAVQLGDALLVEVMLHVGMGRQTVQQAVDMLHVAVRSGSRTMVSMLLQRIGGAALMVPADDGRTALHYARDVATVQLLLAYGADVRAVDAQGARPLDIAIALGLDDVAAALQAVAA